MNEVKTKYDEAIERAEAEVETAKHGLEFAKRQKAKADELWKLVSHLDDKDLEVLYNVIKYKLGREYIDRS